MEKGNYEGIAKEVEHTEGSVVSWKLGLKEKIKCYSYVGYQKQDS